jgi:ribosomal protein S18 acetylase RimI-like enzyme
VIYNIRELKLDEVNILEEMLYEAIFQPDSSDTLPKAVIHQPELSIYINNFGKQHDHCLVAEVEQKIIGAVWVRILAGKTMGYGNIDAETPEFAISLFKDYRNQGIGTALMKKMIEHLKERGYKRASLSVDKDNYAATLYMKLGFEVIEERAHDYIMLLKL